ncbi:MAG TPA: hypothetical protein VGD67_15325 [Pseudonocardiaceae bacterium]
MTRSPLPVHLAAVALCAGSSLTACGQPPPAELVEDRRWLVTVYYTAVESFHDGPLGEVKGCRTRGCATRDETLGSYPRGFADAVREEGTGRITSGEHAGRYLNWSYDIEYWLDDAPRDAHGGVLEPFRSAAADGIPDGTRLRLVDCGTDESGRAVPAGACRTLTAGRWQIRDRFTPGRGGDSHIDLYIGEEDVPDFTTDGETYVSLHDAAFAVER